MPVARTVSVLFTDVVASTELVVELGDRAGDELRRTHHERQRVAVERHGGSIVEGSDDGIMAVFDSAAAAVDAAAAIAEGTVELAREREVPLAVRVGVAAGDATIDAGDWRGAPLVEASRLCQVAAGGQVLVSDLARRLAATRTAAGFESVGELTLAGFGDAVVVHELRARPTSSAHGGEASTRGAAGVRLRLAGRFAVERDGQAVDDRDLGSRKARLLLKALAARRGRPVPMDELVELLWDGEAPANAERNIATLVSRLRAVVGADVIDGGRHGYRLALGPSVELDIDDAERLVVEAEARLASGQPALALSAADASRQQLGSGAVVEDEPAAEWALDVGREAGRLVRRGRAVGWAASLAIGEQRKALAIASEAVDADALDEEAHRAVMLAYYQLGEPGEALKAYARLRTVLVDELGADPGPDTVALHTAILRSEPVPDPAATSAPRVAEPGLAGRSAELNRLVDCWSAASRGTASTALILGEAGIGKTRLAAELATTARTAGALVLQARCYTTERSLFLQPIVELVRSAVATLPPDVLRSAAADRAGPLVGLVPELERVLRPVGYERASGEIERRRVFEAVASFLGGLARQRPLLVVVDDLHQAGESTIELLHFALRWDSAVPMLVVATARVDEADDLLDQLGPLGIVVDVGVLPDDAVLALARQSGRADLAGAVSRLSRGHTLFVVEVLRALSEQGADTGERIGVPETLRAVVALRARRCGTDVEEFLRAAVVAGSSFDVTHVAELLGVAGADAARRAEQARRAGLLVEAGAGYEFANDLIQEVLYDTTPTAMRTVRHRQLAVLLADRPEAAAGHAAAGGEWRTAVTYWRDAASRAAAAFANREAEQLLTRAIGACAQIDDVALTSEVRIARGRARLALGRYSAGADDLTVAEQLAGAVGADGSQAAALSELGWAAYFARDVTRARELAARSVAHPAAGPQAGILLGRLKNADGDVPGALAVLEPLAEPGADVDPSARALALACLGAALAHSDRYDDALRILDDGLTACLQTGVLRQVLNCRMFGAMTRANLGDFATARTWAEQLREDAERFEAPSHLPRALNVLAWIDREMGVFGPARDLAEEALDRCHTPSGEIEGEPAANARLQLAESALLDRDGGSALEHLGEVESLMSGSVAFAWRVDLHRTELLARLEPERAEVLLGRARRHGSAKYEALALAHLGAIDEAVAAAERTRSTWLLARVAPQRQARDAFDALAARLPAELRDQFVSRGPLARQLLS